MVVDSTEVLEPLVVHHLDGVDYLHVVCNFVLYHAGIFDDRVRINLVLMALTLI